MEPLYYQKIEIKIIALKNTVIVLNWLNIIFIWNGVENLTINIKIQLCVRTCGWVNLKEKNLVKLKYSSFRRVRKGYNNVFCFCSKFHRRIMTKNKLKKSISRRITVLSYTGGRENRAAERSGQRGYPDGAVGIHRATARGPERAEISLEGSREWDRGYIRMVSDLGRVTVVHEIFVTKVALWSTALIRTSKKKIYI